MTKLELEKAYCIKIAREQSHPLPEKYNVVGLLDNIRSGLIVGSIIRCADGLGVKRIYCCGITPTPDREEVKKTALGAEAMIKWTYHRNAYKLIQDLQD